MDGTLCTAINRQIKEHLSKQLSYKESFPTDQNKTILNESIYSINVITIYQISQREFSKKPFNYYVGITAIVDATITPLEEKQ